IGERLRRTDRDGESRVREDADAGERESLADCCRLRSGDGETGVDVANRHLERALIRPTLAVVHGDENRVDTRCTEDVLSAEGTSRRLAGCAVLDAGEASV